MLIMLNVQFVVINFVLNVTIKDIKILHVKNMNKISIKMIKISNYLWSNKSGDNVLSAKTQLRKPVCVIL